MSLINCISVYESWLFVSSDICLQSLISCLCRIASYTVSDLVLVDSDIYGSNGSQLGCKFKIGTILWSKKNPRASAFHTDGRILDLLQCLFQNQQPGNVRNRNSPCVPLISFPLTFRAAFLRHHSQGMKLIEHGLTQRRRHQTHRTEALKSSYVWRRCECFPEMPLSENGWTWMISPFEMMVTFIL